MHVVFYKNTFSSFEEALKGTLRTDLVVMSVLFEVEFEFFYCRDKLLKKSFLTMANFSIRHR